MSEIEHEPRLEELTDEERMIILIDIAANLLESEDRQYLAENPEMDFDELSAYVVGRLQDLGYDFEDVYERSGLY